MEFKKHKRNVISLETKVHILDYLAAGEGSTAVGKRFGLHEATIRTIKKNEARIREFVGGSKRLSKKASHTKDAVIEKVESALVIWIEDTQGRIPIDGNIIKQKALRFYKQIKDLEPSTSAQTNENHEFSASSVWLTRFLQRHDFRIPTNSNEINISRDESAAMKFSQYLAKIIDDGRYTVHQVFNAAETNLFWKRMPSKHMKKPHKMIRNFKIARNCVKLLFCSNASGDRILKPLLINRSQRPRIMKDKDWAKMPFYWKANDKPVITEDIFVEWFNKCFVPEVGRYMKDMGLKFKVLLIVDNVHGYPELKHPNVKMIFLPSNTASLIQPLDQGVISTFKSSYVKQTFQYILNKIDDDKKLTVLDAWKQFSIIDCVRCASLALSELRPSILNSCWREVWPACVSNENSVSENTAEYCEIINLAHAVGGEAFDDITFDDIDDFMVGNVLSEDEIKEVELGIGDSEEIDDNEEPIPLSEHVLQEGLELCNKLKDHFIAQDPNIERAQQFHRDLQFCMAPYQDLYNELKRMGSQRTTTEHISIEVGNVRQDTVETTSSLDEVLSISSDDSDFTPVLNKRIRLLPNNDV